MSRVRDSLALREDVAPTAWRGSIASTAASPTELVSVIVPGVSGTDLLGPCQWQPRVREGTVLSGTPPVTTTVAVPLYPSTGDEALVSFDNTGLPWVVVWWPT